MNETTTMLLGRIRRSFGIKSGILLAAITLMGWGGWLFGRPKLPAGPARIYAPIISIWEAEDEHYRVSINCLGDGKGILLNPHTDGIPSSRYSEYTAVPLLLDSVGSRTLGIVPEIIVPRMGNSIDSQVVADFKKKFTVHPHEFFGIFESKYDGRPPEARGKLKSGPCGNVGLWAWDPVEAKNLGSRTPYPPNFELKLKRFEAKIKQHKFLWGDSIFPFRKGEKTSVGLSGTAQYTYKGRVILEQDWYDVGLFGLSDKGWVAYNEEYFVFCDHPYFERRSSDGKCVFHWYVIKIPEEWRKSNDPPPTMEEQIYGRRTPYTPLQDVEKNSKCELGFADY